MSAVASGEAENIQRLLRDLRQRGGLGPGDEQGGEVAVEEQAHGQQRAVLKGMHHPAVQWEHAFA